MDVLSLNLPGMGMCFWASPWTSRDCGLTAHGQSTSSCSCFLVFHGVFHSKGLIQPGVLSSSVGDHLQSSESWQKGVAGVTLLGCLWCLLQVWPWRIHCDTWGCSWNGLNPTQPFVVQINDTLKCFSCSWSHPVRFLKQVWFSWSHLGKIPAFSQPQNGVAGGL